MSMPIRINAVNQERFKVYDGQGAIGVRRQRTALMRIVVAKKNRPRAYIKIGPLDRKIWVDEAYWVQRKVSTSRALDSDD